MKGKLKLFIIGTCLITLYGCDLKKTKIEQAEWLIGTWESQTERGSTYETWTKLSGNELKGISYMLEEKDTIVFETIQLIQNEEGLFYIPKVKNQNDGLPVKFKLKMNSDSSLVFENPLHDFPQVISYAKIGSDSLVAEISGVKNDSKQRQAFLMNRVR